MKLLSSWVHLSGAIKQEYHEGLTLLHDAVIAGQPESVRHLLRVGANRHAKSFEGYTPMLYAVAQKRADLVRLLA